ncbi:MAG: glycosyltransferase, partial [Methylotenera sp.]
MKKINSYGAEMRCYPVIVFAYNRPEHLQRTLSALAETEYADKSPLIIFCDGPKSGQSIQKLDLVKAVANHHIWVEKFASVRVEFSKSNLGLANSIINGVSSVLKDYDAAIVLEDDLIVAPDFLKFMNDCLTYYRDDSHIGSVTGFCPLKQIPKGYTHDVLI